MDVNSSNIKTVVSLVIFTVIFKCVKLQGFVKLLYHYCIFWQVFVSMLNIAPVLETTQTRQLQKIGAMNSSGNMAGGNDGTFSETNADPGYLPDPLEERLKAEYDIESGKISK